jgi:hypothetical protein
MTEKKHFYSGYFALVVFFILNYSFLSAQVKYSKVETDKFSIELPFTWVNDVNYMFFQLMSLAPGDTCCGDFREFITVSSDGQPKKNLDEFYQTEKKYIKEGAKDMHQLKVIGEGIMDINGIKTNWLAYAFNYKGYFWYGRDYYTGIDLEENTFKEFNLVEKDYFFYYNNKGYMLRCTAKETNFKAFEPIFDTVAKSFKFK